MGSLFQRPLVLDLGKVKSCEKKSRKEKLKEKVERPTAVPCNKKN